MYLAGWLTCHENSTGWSAPSEEEFKQLVGKGSHLKLDQDGWPRSDFWGTMLDLIYAGHSDLAWKFCDLAWPGDKKKKAEFLKEFRAQLARSRYYPALRDGGTSKSSARATSPSRR